MEIFLGWGEVGEGEGEVLPRENFSSSVSGKKLQHPPKIWRPCA